MAVEATGGNTVTDVTDGFITYRVHKFTSSGSFVVTSGGDVEYFVVAGGGSGGGGYAGGGGGAGGVLQGTSTVGSDTFSVVVGAGGASSTTIGNNGSNSSVFGHVAIGGGGGGGKSSGTGKNGGSGGGGGWQTSSVNVDYAGGTGVSGQGYAGGTGRSAASASRGGGGGGASAVGSNYGATSGGNGGAGITSDITGVSVGYAGGGGGANEQSGGTRGLGTDGGGDGASRTIAATSGAANTGGGGGGAAPALNSVSGAGGSGIVVLRYVIDDATPYPPSAPTITSVDAGDEELTVNFTAGDPGTEAITNYKYSTDNGVTWITRDPAATTSPIVISGLTNGTEYQVVIRAVSSVGDGAISNMVAATPTAGEANPTFTIVNALVRMDDVFVDPDYESVYFQYAGTLEATDLTSQPLVFAAENILLTYTSSEDDFVEEFEVEVTEPGTAYFDRVTGEVVMSFAGFTLSTENFGGVRFNPDTNLVTVGGSSTVEVWNEDIEELEEQVNRFIFTFEVSGITLVELPDQILYASVGVRSYVVLDRVTSIDGQIGIVGGLNQGTRVLEDVEITGFSNAIVPRRTVMVGKDGVPAAKGFLGYALHGDITWSRSSPSSWSISVPINDDDANAFFNTKDLIDIDSEADAKAMWRGVEDPYHEVQLWRGEQLLNWGPVTSISVSDSTVEITGSDASWYLERRFVGPSNNPNLCLNPLLKNGVDDWYTSIFRGWDNPPTANFDKANINRVRLPADTREWAFRIEDRTPLQGAVDGQLDLNDARNWNFIKSGLTYVLTLGSPPTYIQIAEEAVNIYLNGNWPEGAGIEYSEDAKAFTVGMGWFALEAYPDVSSNISIIMNGVSYALDLAEFSNDPNYYEQLLNDLAFEIIGGAYWVELGISNVIEAEYFATGIVIVKDALYAGNPNSVADNLFDDDPAIAQSEQSVLPTFPTAVQFFQMPVLEAPTQLTFSCWLQVEEFLSPNDEQSGVFIVLFPEGSRELRDAIQFEASDVGEKTPIGQRLRQEVTIEIPANQKTWGAVGVRGPKGVSYAWDFNLEWEGGLISVNIEKAEIERRLVDHLSGNPNASFTASRQYPLRPFLGPEGYGKSDIKLKYNIPNTGYNLTRIYPFNQSVGLDAITELAEDDSTSGWRVVNTLTDRYFTTMRDIGVKWECPMRWLPSGGNLTGVSYSFLGEQGANVVTVFSAYPGSRRQGFHVVPDAFQNGLTIEETMSAPQDTWDDSLPLMARDRAWDTTHPVSLSLTLPAEPYFTTHGLRINHVVPVTIVEGQLRIVGFFRIQTMTLTSDDFLQLECVPAEVKGTSIV